MKLILIAIFSVSLVVCVLQQEALAEDTSGIYYNYNKSYGWKIDSRFDESRLDEVDHIQRSDERRDYKTREPGYRDNNRPENQNRNNDRNREKQYEADQNKNYSRANDKNNYRNSDNDKNEIYNKRDKNRDEGNDKVDGNRDDKGRSDKNKEYVEDDTNGDKYQDKNRKSEKNSNQKIDYRKQESNDKSNGSKNYERQNQYDKTSRDEINIQREKQEKERGEKYNNYESSYNKNDKEDRKENRSKDNVYNKNDKEPKKYEFDNKNNYGVKNDGKGNENNDEGRRYQDKKQDKETKNVGSDKNLRKGKDEYNRESEKDDIRRDDKNKARYNNDQYIEEKQNSRSKIERYSYDNKEKSYAGLGYSYLDSLVTAPKPKSDNLNTQPGYLSKEYKNNRSNKENEKKGEIIEIHGYISKGTNEHSDNQVEVDLIVKKADPADQADPGKGLDLQGGMHIHKVLNNEESVTGSQKEKPQSEFKYEYITPSKRTENVEKDYKKLFNNHVQDKKDLLGGLELLDIISNIGQEIKEQVIEKIPGYNIIKKIDFSRQKSENKQDYYYNQDKKYPKIDLDVYAPKKQQDDSGKNVEGVKSYIEFKKQDAAYEVYTTDKNKSERINNKYFDQDKKTQPLKEIDTHKSAIYSQNKDIKTKKENEKIRPSKENQEVKSNLREDKKKIYDYTISHKPTGWDDKNTKYVTSDNYDKEINKEVYYNSRNSYDNFEKSDIPHEGYKHRENEGYYNPDYFFEPLKVKHGPVGHNHEYPGHGDLLPYRGVSRGLDYQGPGNLRQPDIVNPVADYMKNKQREEKYVYDYTMGNHEKQGPVYNYNTPYSPSVSLGQYGNLREYNNMANNNGYRPDKLYDYKSKHYYDPTHNEGWSYQGFPINEHSKEDKFEVKNNYPKYIEDKDDQAYIHPRYPHGYNDHEDFRYREPYMDKGLPNYNQGFEGGFGSPHTYQLSSLFNPLSQQILGSPGRIKEYYHQNYTKNLGSFPHQRYYNPHFGESKFTESYPNYDNSNNYYDERRPVYDSAYQNSNNEYIYKYQLPYATGVLSVILFVNCEPQRGQLNYEQLTTNNYRNENRDRNDRRREGNERDQERGYEERDQREYRNQGRERIRGNKGSDNVDGRGIERYGPYGQVNLGYPYEGLDYNKEIKKDDRRNKEYRNREYVPYYPKRGYLSPYKNEPKYDFYETFPYPDFAGRRGLGFQRRTHLVNGYTSPLTKDLLEIVGKRPDFEYDRSFNRVSDYYDLYEPKHEPKYDDKEIYYGKKEYKYEEQDLYKTPYPAEVEPFEYHKGLVNTGFNNPIGRDLLEPVGKYYNYNGANYPNLY